MNSKKQSNGSWKAWASLDGRQFQARGKTRREAEAKVIKKMKEAPAQAPKARAARDMPVGEYVSKITMAQVGAVAHRTAHRKNLAWTSRSGQLADLHLGKLSLADVREWREGLGHARSDLMAIEALRLALDVAVEDELIPTNLVRQLRPRRAPQARTDGLGARSVRIYTPAEIEALKAAEPEALEEARRFNDQPMPRLATFLFDTGLRLGEALGLQWADVEGHTLHVRRQCREYNGQVELTPELKTTGSRRSIYVADATLDALGTRGRKGDLIFRPSRGEGLQRRQRVHRHWKRMHRLAGVELNGRSPHSARHSHASLLLQNRVPVGEVAARLGDSVRTVLAYYSWAIPGQDETRAAVDAIVGRVSLGDSSRKR